MHLLRETQPRTGGLCQSLLGAAWATGSPVFYDPDLRAGQRRRKLKGVAVE